MSTYQSSPIRPRILAADKDALLAVKQMPDFIATSSAPTPEAAQALFDAMIAAQSQQKHAADALDASRHAADAAERAFHDAMRNIKLQVIAQYGEDSNEVAAVGLKKRSHYKRRTPKAPALVKPAA